MSDIDNLRLATHGKILDLLRELRAAMATDADSFIGDERSLDGTSIKDAIRSVFSTRLSDKELACFLVVFVGEWLRREGGGHRILEDLNLEERPS
jgi:hypothetical protein